MTPGMKKFFEYARLRQEAYEAKMRGVPKGQQSTDEVINKYSFCNIFREDDKTTIWCRKNVREAYKNSPFLIPAIVTFRMFNRIDVGEAIFCQSDMFDGGNAFDHMMQDKSSVKILRKAILDLKPNGPYATGAYIISSPPGYSKLDGILEVVSRFIRGDRPFRGQDDNPYDWWNMDHYLRENRNRPTKLRLEEVWEWLRQFDYFGKFHAYEIVTDLRHTPLLRRASDVMTWASPGPGCRRGLNRVFGRELGDRVPLDQILREMRIILDQSRDPRNWPNNKWSSWEMREVEHTLCEFDKFCRTHAGEGRPRSVYR